MSYQWIGGMYSIESRLEVGWNRYNMFENKWNQSKTWGCDVRLMLFNYGGLSVIYGVEVWVGIIWLSLGN